MLKFKNWVISWWLIWCGEILIVINFPSMTDTYLTLMKGIILFFYSRLLRTLNYTWNDMIFLFWSPLMLFKLRLTWFPKILLRTIFTSSRLARLRSWNWDRNFWGIHKISSRISSQESDIKFIQWIKNLKQRPDRDTNQSFPFFKLTVFLWVQ